VNKPYGGVEAKINMTLVVSFMFLPVLPWYLLLLGFMVGLVPEMVVAVEKSPFLFGIKIWSLAYHFTEINSTPSTH
jgi:uncharacterized membrane protein